MKYFRELEHDVTPEEFAAMRAEIAANGALWRDDVSRQKLAPPQRHTETIFLRSFTPQPGRKWSDIQESQNTKYTDCFPATMGMARRMAERLGGELCRVLYVRLLPESVVYPHIDDGEYFAIRDRYHFVVESDTGSFLGAFDERVMMKERTLWWFNNKVMHYSANPSKNARVHLIFDLLPAAG